MLTAQERNTIKRQIQANRHEVFIVSLEQMDAVIKSSAGDKGQDVKQRWQQIKSKAELAANYYPTADDIRTIAKLVGDLGAVGTQAYVKTYGGKPHIILKGSPRLRKILTGTKYGINNPKVVTLGLGKAGAIHAAKAGGLLSVALLSSYRVVDYFLTDQATLGQLVGALATDVVKVGIATGASIAAASAVAGAGLTLAIGPIVAVVVVGLLVSVALTALDEQYGITDRVIAALDEVSNSTMANAQQARQQLTQAANKATASVLDYVLESARQVIVDSAKHHLRKFVSNRPRVH